VEIHADQAAANGNQGAGAVVAVLDAGCNTNHLDIKPNILTAFATSFVPGEGAQTTHPGFNHGTNVSGIIAAAINNIGTQGAIRKRHRGLRDRSGWPRRFRLPRVVQQLGTSGYFFAAGTSMATPAVSGVAALIVGKYGHMPPSQLKARLAQSAANIGADAFFGRGRVDALAATTGN